MEKNNLEPCPFCGNTNISTGISFFGGMHSFSCDKCKMDVQFLWKDKEKCVEVWNQRAKGV